MAEQNKREDLNDAVEDALGFNFRSVKTLIDLFVRPRAVFLSYAARDRVTYTPALRLWFGLVGLQVLVSALWGGWEGLLTRQFAEMDPATRASFEQYAGGDLTVFIQHYADATSFLQPIFVALFTSLSVFVLGWFRPQLSWPSRLNIALGVLAAGTVIGLIMLPLLAFSEMQRWAWAPTVMVSLVYFLTTLRGARGVIADTTAGVWTKSIIYTLTLMMLVMLAGFIMAIVCAFYAVAMMAR